MCPTEPPPSLAACVHAQFSSEVAACFEHWRANNVSAAFLRARPKGVTWDCELCPADGREEPGPAGRRALAALQPPVDTDELVELCTTCRGYPEGEPQCLGVPFAQVYLSVPHAMWFVLATVTTVGYGDVTPVSSMGQWFAAVVILSGVAFLAMPLNTIGLNFTQVRAGIRGRLQYGRALE